MDDLVPLLLSILVGLLLLFGVPIAVNSSINESTIDTYVTHATDVLGDQVCKDGYLSQQMYSDYLSELANTGLLYDITLVRSHSSEYPVYDRAGQFTNQTQTIETKTYTKEITEELTRNGIYKFKEGDTFSITVKSRTLTTIQKIYATLGIRNKEGITTFGGGVIADENY